MLISLFVILFLLMCLVGGDQGAKSFLVLCVNGIIFAGSIFFLNKGFSPILLIVISALCFCGMNLFFQNGYNIKTLSAAFAVMSVIFFNGIFIFALVKFGHLTGFNEIDFFEENAMYLSVDLNIKLFQITVCGMIWGLLGAICDTGMAIATATNEVALQHPEYTKNQIFQSGMSVGHDIMGTTVNTLFFVGAGEAIMMALMFYTQKTGWVEIINSKSFMQELSTIIVSCIGCMLIIPLTAFLFAVFFKSQRIHYHIELVEQRQR